MDGKGLESHPLRRGGTGGTHLHPGDPASSGSLLCHPKACSATSGVHKRGPSLPSGLQKPAERSPAAKPANARSYPQCFPWDLHLADAESVRLGDMNLNGAADCVRLLRDSRPQPQKRIPQRVSAENTPRGGAGSSESSQRTEGTDVAWTGTGTKAQATTGETRGGHRSHLGDAGVGVAVTLSQPGGPRASSCPSLYSDSRLCCRPGEAKKEEERGIQCNAFYLQAGLFFAFLLSSEFFHARASDKKSWLPLWSGGCGAAQARLPAAQGPPTAHSGCFASLNPLPPSPQEGAAPDTD